MWSGVKERDGGGQKDQLSIWRRGLPTLTMICVRQKGIRVLDYKIKTSIYILGIKIILNSKICQTC